MAIKKTTRTILNMFLEEDPDTIIRKPNLRRFVKNTEIQYIAGGGIWLINSKQVINALNPKRLTKHDYEIPRIRTLKGCVDEWNKTHPKSRTTIDKHTIEKLILDPEIFKYKIGYHTWLINYDQIEKKLKTLFYDHSKFRKH